MEERKQVKISLGTAICLFIILILVFALLGVLYYHHYMDKNKPKTIITQATTTMKLSVIATEKEDAILATDGDIE